MSVVHFTPSFLLHSLGKENIVKLLINNNADIDAKNKDGHTALHFSAQYGEIHMKIVSEKAFEHFVKFIEIDQLKRMSQLFWWKMGLIPMSVTMMIKLHVICFGKGVN